MKKPIPFGKYYLLERINVGGMAEVFKAKTFGVEGFERLLAVKRILPNIAEDEEFITMFIDEAKIAVQLQHANIAQIFDLGKVDESFFIALEFVHGRDLRSIFDRMRNKGDSLPIAMACYVIMQVCEGLDYAHNKRDAQGRELNLVHRDISPQNVLIGYEGEVKLIDFGIAKAAGKASKTQAGILKGKFGYMSPEQVRGLPIDKRSDIFAVGIVLYELLTGERLFIGESDFSTLEKVRNVEIMPPSSYNKKIPQELERVVLKALARDPEDRYANAIDLHDDLQSFLYSVGEFFSRKDLAAWMKKTFAMEIEEDNAKLEEFRQIAAPVAAPGAEVSRRAAVAGLPAGRTGATLPTGAKPPSKPPKPSGSGKDPASAHQAMGWDDEELDTQIFDKEEVKPVAAEDLFFEDDDRTVANEPAPDILEQARPPELNTPKPIILTPLPDEEIKMTPPPSAARNLPLPPAARRPTLVGVPPAGTPGRVTGPVPTLPPPGPPTGRTGLRRSGLNMPAANVHAPPPAQTRMPTPMAAPSPPARFRAPQEAPFGTGSFDVMSPKRQPRRSVYGLMALAVVVAVGVFYWYSNSVKPGHIQLTTTPGDAVVLIDNVKVGDHSPLSLEKPPGPYTLSVTRDGYARNDQNIELKAGQPLTLAVALEPSPDTGFELTSDPPGGLVWLDGTAVKEASGQQAKTNFRASRIAPGHHVLEIRGDRFKPWQQDVEIEPGAIRKVHAMLIPLVGGPAGSAKPAPIAAAPSGTPGHEVAMATSPTTPVSPPAVVSPPHTPSLDPPTVRKPSAGPNTGGGSNGPAAAAGGAVASPAGGGSPKGRKKREVQTGDEGGGEAPSDETPAPRKSVASDSGGGGGDCTITINSIPWSEVWIDGKNTSQHTPVVDFKLPCGKHKLSFKRSDMQIDQTESINVKPGQNFKQRYTLATDD
ncbi:MAG TPA: protein kinase [Polyangia bacterium]|nr:protein kinase [Polyangia bacterium]